MADRNAEDRRAALHQLVKDWRTQGFSAPMLRHSCSSCGLTDNEQAEIDGWNKAVKACADKLEAALLADGGVSAPQETIDERAERWLQRSMLAPAGLHAELERLCQAVEGYRAGALTSDGLWHYVELARQQLAPSAPAVEKP